MGDITFFIASYFAVVIATIAGFGASTILLPISLFFLEFPIALSLVAIVHFSLNIWRITFFKRGFDKKIILMFGVPSIVLALLGARLVIYTPQEVLRLILGLFLVAFAVTHLIKSKFSLKANLKNNLIGGGLSGFFAGLIGTGGALRSSFLISFNINKIKYIATAAVISLAVDITRIPIYLKSGFLTPEYYYFVPIIFGVSMLGVYTGKKLVDKIPQTAFKKFVLVAILLASIKFIYEGIQYLIG